MPLAFPFDRVVNIKWGGFGLSFNASFLKIWTTPEQSEPGDQDVSLSGPFVGGGIIAGINVPHPTNPDGYLAESGDTDENETREEGETEVCVSRNYELWADQYEWREDGPPWGPVEATWRVTPIETQAFGNAAAAQDWADSFNDPLFTRIAHFAVPLECVATEVRPWRQTIVSRSNYVNINVGAIRTLMKGDDPNAETPTVEFVLVIPGFRSTRTSGSAGITLTVPSDDEGGTSEHKTEDGGMPDVGNQDYPAQTITVTVHPDNTIDVEVT